MKKVVVLLLVKLTWKDVTTDELFNGKRVVMFSLPVHLHLLVQDNNYLCMMSYILNLKHKVMMMYIVYQ